MTDQQPVEHCGHQPDPVIGRATECVLRSGHSGSHADRTGMRWWMRQPTDPGRRHTVDTITDPQLTRLYDRIDTLEHVARSNLRHVQAIVPELEAADAARLALRQRAEQAEAELIRSENARNVLRRTLINRTQRAERITARAERAETALAALHEGEQPHDDERTVPTPAQWIWRWNRATPAKRLEVAAHVIADAETAGRCFMAGHQADLDRLRLHAEQLEDLLRVAHDTSNRSETERARAVERANRVEGERGDLLVKLAAVRADRDRWRDQARTEQADRRDVEAAIERVRAECDRVEAAVHDNPTSPDLAGGYIACLRHIRAALDEHQEQR